MSDSTKTNIQNILLRDGRSSIAMNRYVFIDENKYNAWNAYRRIVSHVATSERDRWDTIVSIREGDRHGFYIWPRPNGFEFVATEAVLREHESFCSKWRNVLQKTKVQ